jgi:hypothetical protein
MKTEDRRQKREDRREKTGIPPNSEIRTPKGIHHRGAEDTEGGTE